MLCVLFRSYLLLAAPAEGNARYEVKAIVNMGGLRIEEPDNGRGMWQYTVLSCAYG